MNLVSKRWILTMTEWRTVKDFPNYVVSDKGTVKNKNTKHILKQRDKQGYMCVQLSKIQNGQQLRKSFFVHRLVARAFIPNKENRPQVNHKDRNTRNNVVENLEWCTASQNVNYLDANKRRGESLGHPVVAINLLEKSYTIYPSSMEAARVLGINHMNIVQIIKNQRKRKSAKGHTFVDAKLFTERNLGNYINLATNCHKPYPRQIIGWRINDPDNHMRFNSISEAAKFVGGHDSGIRKVLKGEYAQTKGWKFVEAIGEKLDA